MTDTLKTFGVKEFTRLASSWDAHVEQIRLLGYTIVPGALAADELAVAREKLDGIYQRQVEEVGGEARLAAINDGYTVRCPLVYDDFFLALATNRAVLSVVERLLGDYFVLMLQNGLLNVPAEGNEQNAGSWHRDLNYQHFVSTRPLSISALFCVDDFTEENGGTSVLPATHKAESFPSEEFVRDQSRPIEAPAGSVLVFDSMLYHRGGLNRTARVRRAVNHMYTLPFIKQQISLPQALGGRFCEDPFLAKLLGYESEPDPSVREFREKRLARLGA
ncbi:MAG TPA: phytanoyl-CoA dioxygenase family protein [Pyrinomonadaceae bacterium]|nr:phytanoyl-CoA dioxygenase family protein [Pyrinomonadaceae bacterium]